MASNIMSFKDYLNGLKKDELNNVVSNYNKLSTIFNSDKLDVIKLRKEEIINLILDNKKEYLKFIISTFDLKDYKELNKGLLSKDLQKFLINYNVLDKNGMMYQDLKKQIDTLFKDKELIKRIKIIDNINNCLKGLIIAYGVVDINYYRALLGKYCDVEEILNIHKIRGNNDYKIEKNRIISSLLTNKKRIDRYYKNDNYKIFGLKELKLLGTSKYHYSLKNYKRLIGLLKNYYVFKRKDIKFIDDNIIIPYLYTAINEENCAKDLLNTKLEEYFEFRKDRLKDKIFKEVDEIRNNFPLWEYRGYSKNEVKDDE